MALMFARASAYIVRYFYIMHNILPAQTCHVPGRSLLLARQGVDIGVACCRYLIID